MRVVIEDDAGVEHVVGVEQRLEAPHELIGTRAPLHLHVWGHVAPSAVLTLEGSTVLGGDDVAHLVHHIAEPLHLIRGPETLREDEVQVALKGVAEAGGVLVLVLLEHLHQVHRHVRQLVNRACHVLNQETRPRLTAATDNGNEPLADVPKHFALRWVLAEGVLGQLLGLLCPCPQRQPAVQQRAVNLMDARLEALGTVGAALDEEGSRLRPRVLHVRDQTQQVLIDLTLPEGGAVEHFHGVHGGLGPQHGGGSACRVHIREHHESR
mmetsp:Transcript_19238/g.58061  ORF Transcript_19238/g.58061 Transcript_19238/m.58061 type:complete len:267 (+) Transcript_19238:4576-5376(+)